MPSWQAGKKWADCDLLDTYSWLCYQMPGVCAWGLLLLQRWLLLPFVSLLQSPLAALARVLAKHVEMRGGGSAWLLCNCK